MLLSNLRCAALDCDGDLRRSLPAGPTNEHLIWRRLGAFYGRRASFDGGNKLLFTAPSTGGRTLHLARGSSGFGTSPSAAPSITTSAKRLPDCSDWHLLLNEGWACQRQCDDKERCVISPPLDCAQIPGLRAELRAIPLRQLNLPCAVVPVCDLIKIAPLGFAGSATGAFPLRRLSPAGRTQLELSGKRPASRPR
jgi:hypothetical protein